VITELTNVNNSWVYQSNKLIEASYSFTVLEQKLIRLLASMIKKDDEELKEYKFKAVDLGKILNIHQKNIYKELDQITDKLMARYIKIKNDDKEKFKKRHLIKIADFENGMLTMKIDEDMKEFYLKLNWYTKYQLKNIMQFKSTYSFRLYELLKQYEKIGHRKIEIDDLRAILDISKDQYPKYANLKQKVITVAVEEINKNTDLHIIPDDKNGKIGRKITSVMFHISQNRALGEVAAGVVEEAPEETDLKKQVQGIFHKHKIKAGEAAALLKDAGNDIELIKKCYEYSLTKNKVENVVGYVRALLKGFNEPQNNVSKGTFNNFEQRTYNFEELEKKLLGWK
jgi:plasmid replication initiation protein